MELNRRDFLKSGALIGGAAAIGGVLGGCSPSSSSSTSSVSVPTGTATEDFKTSVIELTAVTKFADTKTYDVVVIGAGTAGVPAVLSALEEGASVACLQKPSQVMANGNGSSGVILEESNDVGILQYMQAWRKAGGYRMNWNLLKAFTQHSGETSMWMLQRSNDVGYLPYSVSATKTTYDDGNYCTAVLKSYGPKPENHQTIMTKLAAYAATKGAEFFYETPAVQLVKASDGSITGVIGKTSSGSYIKFNANKAVIIAAGDYQNNDSMVSRWSPDVTRFGRKQSGRTGDGILLALTVGAVMTPVNHAKTMHDMDAAPMMLTSQPFMALNENGERFMNEEIPMESWDLTLRTRQGVSDPGRFFRIFDNDYVNKYNAKAVPISTLENYIPGYLPNPTNVYTSLIDTHRANTLDELATQLGIPADALKKSVEKWNAYCAAGKDAEYGVLQANLKPINTPPYWGIRQWIRCSAINSGVVVDANYRVLDANNNVIKGLYSVGSGAGDISGGLEWNLSQGGLCCGSYMDMGRYAAIHAVTGGTTPKTPATYADTKKYWTK
jgi:fumarate reductase flavoprotein subunit